ncbi:MAG: PEP-CTERM sorting domain-containing protein, partial [Verrucomicrobia bacterium]|nr:PEP-CTERM sorting domain-containing protein [Verrucomicrobiota bacterium]
CLPASLLGRFTTSPINPVPEPATALLSLAGMVLLLRRKRD